VTSNWDRAKRADREYFTSSERKAILRRDRYSCYRCGQHATDVDHVVPQAEGGAHSPENAAAICETCHKTKSRVEAARGYARRQERLRLPTDPHPFDS
jgi:5-methylcytosine-specific restriction protein A